jgi:hypothetical protein
LAKQVSGSKKAHPNPPANKGKKVASAETAEDASSGQDDSETTDEVTSLEQDGSGTIDATASSVNGNSAIKSSKK